MNLVFLIKVKPYGEEKNNSIVYHKNLYRGAI
ncbi:hypothetical protein BH23BAC1_BH23BAC1_44330 [soil metagenome]